MESAYAQGTNPSLSAIIEPIITLTSFPLTPFSRPQISRITPVVSIAVASRRFSCTPNPWMLSQSPP